MQRRPMQTADPMAADRSFFAALIAADVGELERLLAEDFSLVDLAGSILGKASLIAAVQAGNLKFDSIEPVEASVRFYPGAAVVVGRTLIEGHLGTTPFTIKSRYTHLYMQFEGAWRLAAAQGTPITGEV